jgi:hypothetical protein
MNISKKENLDLYTAYNEIINLIPIDFITKAIFVTSFFSLLILLYIKFFYSKKISKEQKEILFKKGKVRFLLSFCITTVVFSFMVGLLKSISWLASNLPDGSGGLIVAIVGIVMLCNWKRLFSNLD